MTQRPAGAPQQPRPAAPHGQQPRSITPQTQRQRLGAQGAALRPPPRSAAGGQGTLGRPIKLSANHFAVVMKKTILYHYDVEVKPLPPKTIFKYCFFV
jgi:eukaryotic translation initiation factor 2C